MTQNNLTGKRHLSEPSSSKDVDLVPSTVSPSKREEVKTKRKLIGQLYRVSTVIPKVRIPRRKSKGKPKYFLGPKSEALLVELGYLPSDWLERINANNDSHKSRRRMFW